MSSLARRWSRGFLRPGQGRGAGAEAGTGAAARAPGRRRSLLGEGVTSHDTVASPADVAASSRGYWCSAGTFAPGCGSRHFHHGCTAALTVLPPTEDREPRLGSVPHWDSPPLPHWVLSYVSLVSFPKKSPEAEIGAHHRTRPGDSKKHGARHPSSSFIPF